MSYVAATRAPFFSILPISLTHTCLSTKDHFDDSPRRRIRSTLRRPAYHPSVAACAADAPAHYVSERRRDRARILLHLLPGSCRDALLHKEGRRFGSKVATHSFREIF